MQSSIRGGWNYQRNNLVAVNKYIIKATPRMSPTETPPLLRKLDELKEKQGGSIKDDQHGEIWTPNCLFSLAFGNLVVNSTAETEIMTQV